PLKRAVVYASARGIFDLHLNGGRASRDLFAPEWTDYRKRIQYRAWDVTKLLAQGGNAIGVVLADGWYGGYLAWFEKRANYGDRNSALVQLDIEYMDGSRQTVVSDRSWRCATGPILDADFLMGESYDARLDLPGWDSSGYDDGSWAEVTVLGKPAAALVAQPSQPVRVTEEIEPSAMFQPQPGVYVFDLGQNIAGWARLRVAGEAGRKVVLRFAERLNPDSTIYVTNLRKARVTDTYILKGGGEEIWEPRFTFHGFQYVEVSGFPGVPDKKSITGCVVHSDTPPVGSFECSNPMVNRLWHNIVRSQRGNFISIPTDCPQRDERLGWMGDAQIFIRTATYNEDVAAFFYKWMYDVQDGQSEQGAYSEISPTFPPLTEHAGAAGWADAGIIVPWTVYLVYGDTRIIERHWESMTRWLDYIQKDNPDLIRGNGRGSDYGDWLSIGADTPKEILATAYWAYDARLMSRMATATGREEDSRRYGELFEGIRAAFQ
ncbi:MAG TPA: family 78 glycoside hydrolase catalytic domain, partial [Candidatus Glassbacteria bacterium]|nr:family 78 glycoside hydrolase catalytic domain [Candidatus Glassbacteria bacterium]